MFHYKKDDNIGPFIVIEQIKEGAYAETYKVKAPSGMFYFLKLLEFDKMTKTQFDETSNAVELNVSRKLKSDILLKLHGYGGIFISERKFAYIVYDYIDGITLQEWYNNHKVLPLSDAIRITNDVLACTDYIHTQDPEILHNNITLDNVMIVKTEDGIRAKLIDFGHAKFEDQDYSFFEHEGDSIFYLAPESFNGESSIQSDIYSVGVLLYTLIYGSLPFYLNRNRYRVDDNNWKELVYTQKQETLKIPSLVIPGLNKEILGVIQKALSFDPKNRFNSSKAFMIALTEAQKGITSSEMNNYSSKSSISGFAAIAGMQSLKEQLQNDVIDVLKDSKRAQSLGIAIPNGLLLYGPPGCGKTYFAEKFAEEMGCKYIYVKCSDVASPYIHGGQEKIAKIFNDARDNAPTILFLDEIEAMITDRSQQTNVSEAGEVNEFLAQMNNCGKDGVLVIGATNNPLKIDKAAIRGGRLELKYYIGNPDLESRKSLFEINLKGRAVSGPIDTELLANKTPGYASVDIKTIVDNAGRYVFKNKRDSITMEDLLYALGQTKSSLTPAQIAQYETIRNAFENIKPSRTKIGF